MIRTITNARRRRAGFTLLEVLIVMAIIIIIMGLGGVYVFRSYEDAHRKAAEVKAHALGQAAQRYNIQFKAFPDTLAQLAAPPEGQPFVEQSMLTDPWGGTFQYDPAGPRNNGLKPDVWTTAKDGTVVGNWPSQ